MVVFLMIMQNLMVEIDDVVSEVVDDSSNSAYRCDKCNKLCQSKRGLSRHINTKHAVDL